MPVPLHRRDKFSFEGGQDLRGTGEGVLRLVQDLQDDVDYYMD